MIGPLNDLRNDGLRPIVCILSLGFVFLSGCAVNSPDYRNQKSFKKPAMAVTELAAAVKDGDIASLEAILGPDAQAVLSSGDPVADRHQREVFTIAIQEGWTLEKIDKGVQELIVGHERWPFPIPLVKDRHGWWFNTDAGKWEILARRIGSNELAAIGVLGTYVIAQKEYAGQAHDGKPAGLFAQKIRSTTKKRDGLYWPADSSGEKPSPLGRFAAQAAVEGYFEPSNPPKGRIPYHGYYFKILTRQGNAAAGGTMSYIHGGKMTKGFAMIAYPAAYGNSGIMTFIVAQDGIIYESDLGEQTQRTAGTIDQYNPDERWEQVRLW